MLRAVLPPPRLWKPAGVRRIIFWLKTHLKHPLPPNCFFLHGLIFKLPFFFLPFVGKGGGKVCWKGRHLGPGKTQKTSVLCSLFCISILVHSGVFLPVMMHLPVKTACAAVPSPCPEVNYSSELLSTSEGNSGQEKVVLRLVAPGSMWILSFF